jgi:predicted nucleotidyltransferase
MQQQQTMPQQAQCCCETKMLISETAANQRYESAMQNNAVLQAIQAEGNATRQMMQQDKIEALNQKVQTLEMKNAMAGVVRYPMSTAYNAGYNPFCTCNNPMNCMAA